MFVERSNIQTKKFKACQSQHTCVEKLHDDHYESCRSYVELYMYRSECKVWNRYNDGFWIEKLIAVGVESDMFSRKASFICSIVTVFRLPFQLIMKYYRSIPILGMVYHNTGV